MGGPGTLYETPRPRGRHFSLPGGPIMRLPGSPRGTLRMAARACLGGPGVLRMVARACLGAPGTLRMAARACPGAPGALRTPARARLSGPGLPRRPRSTQKDCSPAFESQRRSECFHGPVSDSSLYLGYKGAQNGCNSLPLSPMERSHWLLEPASELQRRSRVRSDKLF